jgi:hypothetical protein
MEISSASILPDVGIINRLCDTRHNDYPSIPSHWDDVDGLHDASGPDDFLVGHLCPCNVFDFSFA